MGEAARLELNDTGVRVTVIEPGMVDTPFFDAPVEMEALEADDLAADIAIASCCGYDVNEILIRPTAQSG